jgi:hypothetical protein
MAFPVRRERREKDGFVDKLMTEHFQSEPGVEPSRMPSATCSEELENYRYANHSCNNLGEMGGSGIGTFS